LPPYFAEKGNFSKKLPFSLLYFSQEPSIIPLLLLNLHFAIIDIKRCLII